uniref:Uncharacterized protein n=1 Tax=Oryzias sinensis TaxID=183150 RepID=A0A8C7Z409_9TELE
MSASDTPKSRLETRSFPPVSTPAPPPPPAAPLKPLKPLSNMSCCHLSGSCLGCNRRKRTHLLTSGSPASVFHRVHTAGCWCKQVLHFQHGQGAQQTPPPP